MIALSVQAGLLAGPSSMDWRFSFPPSRFSPTWIQTGQSRSHCDLPIDTGVSRFCDSCPVWHGRGGTDGPNRRMNACGLYQDVFRYLKKETELRKARATILSESHVAFVAPADDEDQPNKHTPVPTSPQRRRGSGTGQSGVPRRPPSHRQPSHRTSMRR